MFLLFSYVFQVKNSTEDVGYSYWVISQDTHTYLCLDNSGNFVLSDNLEYILYIHISIFALIHVVYLGL